MRGKNRNGHKMKLQTESLAKPTKKIMSENSPSELPQARLGWWASVTGDGPPCKDMTWGKAEAVPRKG